VPWGPLHGISLCFQTPRSASFPLVAQLPLPPGQIGRDQGIDVCVDSKMSDDIDAGDRSQDDEGGDDLQGMMRSPSNNEASQGGQRRARRRAAGRIRLRQRPFYGHRQTPKTLSRDESTEMRTVRRSLAGLGTVPLPLNRLRRGMILLWHRAEFRAGVRLWILAVCFAEPLPRLALAKERQ